MSRECKKKKKLEADSYPSIDDEIHIKGIKKIE
jgi:hypothetical protein